MEKNLLHPPSTPDRTPHHPDFFALLAVSPPIDWCEKTRQIPDNILRGLGRLLHQRGADHSYLNVVEAAKNIRHAIGPRNILHKNYKTIYI